jgi:hypothetical protein
VVLHKRSSYARLRGYIASATFVDMQHSIAVLAPQICPQLVDTVLFPLGRVSASGRGSGGSGRPAAQGKRRASAPAATKRKAAGRRKPAKRKRIVLSSSEDEVEAKEQQEGGDDAAIGSSPELRSPRRRSGRRVKKLHDSDIEY